MSKPVEQLDLNGNVIKTYSSVNEAKRQNKCCKVWECVSGKRKQAGGYIWRYKTDNHVMMEVNETIVKED